MHLPKSWEWAAAEALRRHDDYRVLTRLREDSMLRLPVSKHEVAAAYRVAVLDTETTGLDPATDKVVEIAVRVELVLEFAGDDAPPPCLSAEAPTIYHGLEDPGAPLTDEIRRVTGLTDADLAGRSFDDDALRAVLQGVDFIVAHKARFDRPFCVRRWPWMADAIWLCSLDDVPWREAGADGGNSLQALANWQDRFFGGHRATTDTMALTAVLNAWIPDPARNGRCTNGWAHLFDRLRHGMVRIYAWKSPFEVKDRLKARGYQWNADQKVWFRDMAGPASADNAAVGAEIQWLRGDGATPGAKAHLLQLQNRWDGA